MYEAIVVGARCAGAPTSMLELFAALRNNREATNEFLSAITGATSLGAFMSPDNLGRIVGSATALT